VLRVDRVRLVYADTGQEAKYYIVPGKAYNVLVVFSADKPGRYVVRVVAGPEPIDEFGGVVIAEGVREVSEQEWMYNPRGQYSVVLPVKPVDIPLAREVGLLEVRAEVVGESGESATGRTDYLVPAEVVRVVAPKIPGVEWPWDRVKEKIVEVYRANTGYWWVCPGYAVADASIGPVGVQVADFYMVKVGERVSVRASYAPAHRLGMPGLLEVLAVAIAVLVALAYLVRMVVTYLFKAAEVEGLRARGEIVEKKLTVAEELYEETYSKCVEAGNDPKECAEVAEKVVESLNRIEVVASGNESPPTQLAPASPAAQMQQMLSWAFGGLLLFYIATRLADALIERVARR